MRLQSKMRNFSVCQITILLSLLPSLLSITWINFSFCPKQSSNTLEKIHKNFVFADMHAHPDKFHRDNISRISEEELDRYRRGLIDLVVCCVSSDAAYQGGYTKRNGTLIPRLDIGKYYALKPGEAFAFTMRRLELVLKTIELSDVELASNPSSVMEAKERDKLALMLALEGADGLEGKIENLYKLHEQGLRLLQLVHFRPNELGHVQTKPYKAGGLTKFGREVVNECNRLRIIIDLAHAHKQTTMDALEISKHPIICSHTGVKALYKDDRYLSDDEIQAIALAGGIIGIWPSSSFPTMEDMVRHIDYVKKLVGVEHVGIGSDLRGMNYTPEFGEEANFRAIAKAMIKHGYSDDEVGKVMGSNFFRLWEQINSEK